MHAKDELETKKKIILLQPRLSVLCYTGQQLTQQARKDRATMYPSAYSVPSRAPYWHALNRR